MKSYKTQISNYKSQINLKLQYPMTKTDELVKRQKTFLLKIIFAFGILNFGHCDLFEIWYLCFGISGLSGLAIGAAHIDEDFVSR
jgi:hypothetical protein